MAGFLHLPDPLGRNIVQGSVVWVPYAKLETDPNRERFPRTSRWGFLFPLPSLWPPDKRRLPVR